MTAVEIKDITLPDNMQRAMAKEAEAEAVSFLVSKFSSISTLLGSRRKICQRALLGTWLT